MITEIVTLRLPQAATREEIIAKFEKTAPAWRENPDLIRKSYLYDADNGIVGGVYLWSDKSDAEKWHGAEFRRKALEAYGAEPDIRYFETPIMVDNLEGIIAVEV
jgi:hypothetical protein